MSLWKFLFGGGVRQVTNGAADLGRVFLGDKAAQEAAEAAAYRAALGQFGAEFTHPTRTWFDALVDGLNRLPRPVMAFSTLGLFAYAMADPVSFTARMQGLAHIPEPLWWILGAVITFYFGSRIEHHRRVKPATPAEVRNTLDTIREIEAMGATPEDDAADTGENAALRDWRAENG